MEEKTNEALRVSIFDPTGNITALVESPVAPEEQSAAAAQIVSSTAKTVPACGQSVPAVTPIAPGATTTPSGHAFPRLCSIVIAPAAT